MWPVSERLLPIFGAISIPCCACRLYDVAFVQPDWDFDRDGDAVGGEHEALQDLVSQPCCCRRRE